MKRKKLTLQERAARNADRHDTREGSRKRFAYLGYLAGYRAAKRDACAREKRI